MNDDYQARLEREIDVQLKALPELEAPSTLAATVMARLHAQASLPWYRRSWQTWGPGARTLCLASLAVVFVRICFGGEWGQKMAPTAPVLEYGRSLASAFGLLRSALDALGSAVKAAVFQLGTGFVTGCAVALGLGYALCVGLGTVYVRLALGRR
jgi:hypothetical protein